MDEIIKEGNFTVHAVDLSLPANKRWALIIEQERQAAQKLFTEAKKEYKNVPSIALDAFGLLYEQFDGLFQAEFQAWATGLGLSFGEIVAVNCGYELDHFEQIVPIPDWIKKMVFGCTTGIREVDGQGMVHVRTLDWDLKDMGAATRLFRFQTKPHEFIAIGFPGFLGVLSGMVPGQYSATINWAPPTTTPDFHYGPSFLLRKVLQECTTYEQAVHSLCHRQLSTGVFYTVCGTQSGQACVIERTAEDFRVRPLTNGLEAQSNHYVTRQGQSQNTALHHQYRNDPLIKTTEDRHREMEKQLRTLDGKRVENLGELLSLLTRSPITNDETAQRMVFCPVKGKLCLERRAQSVGSQAVWERFSWNA